MSISFHPLAYHAAERIFRCLPESHVDPDGWEINLSNANGYNLQEALGLDPVSCGELPIEKFAALVTAAMRSHLDQRSPAVEPRTDATRGRMTITHCARRVGYIESRLNDLALLIQRGRAADATHFGWS